MTNNTQQQQISQLNVIPKKLISLFSRAVAKLLLKFNISRHDYNHSLNEQLVLEAQRQNPNATKVELAVRTGIDRRFITGYLSGEPPAIKSNKLILILRDIEWALEEFYPGKRCIPKRGPFKTFESICEQWSSGTLTYKAILKELTRIGSVIDRGDNIELVEVKYEGVEEIKKYFGMSANLINRYSDTIIYNLKNIDVVEKNYQMSVFSTRIAPENLDDAKREMLLLLRDYKKDIGNILVKYESLVKSGEYPAYGVSILEFNDRNEV
jgi:hypothetical protein